MSELVYKNDLLIIHTFMIGKFEGISENIQLGDIVFYEQQTQKAGKQTPRPKADEKYFSGWARGGRGVNTERVVM